MSRLSPLVCCLFFLLLRSLFYQAIRNMFSFSAAENILAEFPKTRYTYFDQEEKKVQSEAATRNNRTAVQRA